MKCFICGIDMDHIIEDLQRCPECGLISSLINPDTSLYDKSYCRKYERYERSNKADELNAYRFGQVRRIYTSKAPPIILDYGCGSGSFSFYCHANSSMYPVINFDLNPFSQFCRVENLFQPFNILTMWDSIEHIKRPDILIGGLGPSHIVISTPNSDAFLGDRKLMVDEYRHYYPGEHVHYFGHKSLSAMLNKLGYTVGLIDFGESNIRKNQSDIHIETDYNIITIGASRKGA